MYSLKFSHFYVKFPENVMSKTTMLMQLLICDKKDLSEDFIRYDTAYETDHGTEYYQLPDGKLMVLFLLCEKQLFTTIRRWDWEKEIFYRNLIGKAVGIEIRYE